MKKTVKVLLLLLPAALAALFFFFQEAIPGGYTYEEHNDTVTIYESYDTPVDNFQENEDISVDLTLALLKNAIDQQLITLFWCSFSLQVLFFILITKDKITSRDYAEMSGKVIYWFLIIALIVSIIVFIFSYVNNIQDIEAWIDNVNRFKED